MKKLKSPRDYALYLLGRREYSVLEMREKLEKKFPEEIADIKILIQNFIEKDWLSDKRFIEVFIRDQKMKKIGPFKIIEKLWKKGIEKSFAEEALNEFYSEREQIEIVKYLMEKKLRLLSNKEKDSSQAQNDNRLCNKNENFLEAYANSKFFLEGEEINFEVNQKIKKYILGRGFGFDVIEKVFE